MMVCVQWLCVWMIVSIGLVQAQNDTTSCATNSTGCNSASSICNRRTSDSSEEISEDFRKLCQLLNISTVENNGTRKDPHSRPPSSAVWGYGLLCVTVISLMSVMGVAVLPFMSKAFYSSLLTMLIGLAVGSLSGSALFHLIPAAFGLSDVFPHHSYLDVSIVIFAGIYFFFIIERILKLLMEFKSRKQGSVPHVHSVSVRENDDADSGGGECVESESRNRLVELAVEENGEAGQREGQNFTGACAGGGMGNKKQLYEQSKPAMRASFGHMERPAPPSETRPDIREVSRNNSPIATVAYMIIFGDGVHNFIDGLSIGAAFSDSILTGISVSLAVLCEEFPHELGDFAVLLNAGMTVKQAISYNFLSACTCYLGLILGILLGELNQASQIIFALAGGMFLYISLVDMVPELNEAVDDALKKGGVKKALFVFLLQNIGILTGIASLFFLAKYQDDIHIDI